MFEILEMKVMVDYKVAVLSLQVVRTALVMTAHCFITVTLNIDICLDLYRTA